MDSFLLNIILGLLVCILTVLLIIRHRQLKQSNPLNDLHEVLEGLRLNLLANRTDGKIQKIAGQLSKIMINSLETDKILFFRKQRRFMEMNYVYGLKNIRRSRYRIKLSNALTKKLTVDKVITHPRELKECLGRDMSSFIKEHEFNIVFPIFWMDRIFGVYFIKSGLAVNHPLVQTFLLFLNHNLSAAYHIKNLESSRQLLEKKIEESDSRDRDAKISEIPSATDEEQPGHLIEMFSHRNIDDLIVNLFGKVKAGLSTNRLVYMSPAFTGGENKALYSIGIDDDDFELDGDCFGRIFGKTEKQKIYDLSFLNEVPETGGLLQRLKNSEINNIAPFSLSDNDPGLLFWSGKLAPDQSRDRLLSRLEKVARKAVSNALEFERVEEMSYTDGLTGLYNHRYFIKRLNEEIQRANRFQRGLGLLLFDIDDFKVFNDNFGHQLGDHLLRRMGSALSKSLRAIDIVSRYGGDEFCIIMPEADKSTCGFFMERLRKAISSTDFHDSANGFKGSITISIGSAIYPDDAATSERLIYCSDMALLRSKTMGRNRCTIFEPEILEH